MTKKPGSDRVKSTCTFPEAGVGWNEGKTWASKTVSRVGIEYLVKGGCVRKLRYSAALVYRELLTAAL